LLFVIFEGYRIPIREGCDEPLAGDVSRTQTVPRELSGFEIEAFGRREGEERFDLEGRQRTQDLLQTKKRGLPWVQCTLLGWGAISFSEIRSSK
jgi:hypothetical protein